MRFFRTNCASSLCPDSRNETDGIETQRTFVNNLFLSDCISISKKERKSGGFRPWISTNHFPLMGYYRLPVRNCIQTCKIRRGPPPITSSLKQARIIRRRHIVAITASRRPPQPSANSNKEPKRQGKLIYFAIPTNAETFTRNSRLRKR